jgi:hypothetical protein
MGLGLTPDSFKAYYFTRDGKPEAAQADKVAAAGA